MSYFWTSESSESEVESCSKCGQDGHLRHRCPVVWCKLCRKCFSRYDSLALNKNSREKHLKLCHTCNKCGEEGHSKDDCPVVWCKVCKKSFSDYESLDANNNSCKQHMKRRHTCSKCGKEGHALEDCPVVWCKECGRCFSYYNCLANNENSRKMHMQTHKPKDIGCPRKQFGGSCKSTKLFRTGADATAHVEAGGCGQGAARGQDEVYGFLRKTAPHLINKAIGYDGISGDQRPEYPYKCNFCDKIFKKASSLTQHSDAVHGCPKPEKIVYGYSGIARGYPC